MYECACVYTDECVSVQGHVYACICIYLSVLHMCTCLRVIVHEFVFCVCVCVCVCVRARARARVRVYVYAYVSVGGWLGGCCKCGCVLLRLSFVNQEETDKDGGEYVVFNICLLI